MSDQKHTPEPWKLGFKDVFVSDRLGNQVAGCSTGSIIGKEAKANAARIVAAVNYCKGTPNEELEAGSLEQLKAEGDHFQSEYTKFRQGLYEVNIIPLQNEIAKLKAERDELIRILKVVETAISHDRSYQNTHRAITTILNEIKP